MTNTRIRPIDPANSRTALTSYSCRVRLSGGGWTTARWLGWQNNRRTVTVDGRPGSIELRKVDRPSGRAYVVEGEGTTSVSMSGAVEAGVRRLTGDPRAQINCGDASCYRLTAATIRRRIDEVARTRAESAQYIDRDGNIGLDGAADLAWAALVQVPVSAMRAAGIDPYEECDTRWVDRYIEEAGR